jgi:8-oxo-dGTP diphosphatase
VLDGHRVLAVVDPIRREPVLPGGHASWRESPEDACVRETREETGLSVSVQRLVGVFSGEAVTGEPGVVRVIYCADAVGGALESSGEGEARWMTVEEFIRGSRRDGPILQQALACAKGHLSQ